MSASPGLRAVVRQVAGVVAFRVPVYGPKPYAGDGTVVHSLGGPAALHTFQASSWYDV
jgi:hypothetical protein